jgi:RNA polymerase sigma-70 factor (ECF subfamily)
MQYEPMAGVARDRDAAPAQSLAQLFRECNEALHSFLVARLGNEDDAQEVAQEAFARLLQFDRQDTLSFPRAYLFKTAVNIATDRMRQRGTRARLDEFDIEGAAERIDSASPDRRALAAEEVDLIERALEELPSKYRRAFLLRRFEGWTTEKIAKELFEKKRMVRNYVARTAIYCQLRIEGMSAAKAWAEVVP